MSAEAPWRLALTLPSGERQRHRLDPARLGADGLILGREPGLAALLVEDPAISRRHCRLAFGAEGRPTVTDLGSRHGTLLNGRRLPPEVPHPLSPGDRLDFGSVRAEIEGPAAAGAAASRSLPPPPTVTGPQAPRAATAAPNKPASAGGGRLARRVAVGVGVLVAVLLVALIAVPPLLDFRFLAPRIAAAVEDATGRPLTFGGPIRLALLPTLRLEAQDVRLGHARAQPAADGAAAPDGGRGDPIVLPRLIAELPLLPLLAGRIEIDRLVLERPQVELAIAADGTPDWLPPPSASDPPPESGSPDPAPAAAALPRLALADVTVTDGTVLFTDARTGQRIEVVALAAQLALPALDAALTLGLEATVNARPLRAELALDSPGALMAGGAFSARAGLEGALVRVALEGRFSPGPEAEGRLDLEVPAVGALAAWLDRPLARTEPGPLSVTAALATEGGRIVLSEARLAGQDLALTAAGSAEPHDTADGRHWTVVGRIEGGRVDLDRYLPPPAASAPGGPALPDLELLLAGLSDEALDLGAARRLTLDLALAVEGLRLGRLALGRTEALLRGGDGVIGLSVPALELEGGRIGVTVELDAAASPPTLAARAEATGIDAAALAETLGPALPPLSGRLDGSVDFASQGASPRALARALTGTARLELAGGVAVPGRPALTGLGATLALPGLTERPGLDVRAVWNGQPVTLGLSAAPLPELLGAERVATRFDLAAPLIEAAWEGDLITRPLPGLDGRFTFATPSAGGLAAWLGMPGGDPGPLSGRLVLAATGQRTELREGVLTGADGLDLRLSGVLEQAEPRPRLSLALTGGVLDLDRWLPPPSPSSGPGSGGADLPLDPGPLGLVDAEVTARLAGLVRAPLRLGALEARLSLTDRVAALDLARLGLGGGGASGSLRLDGRDTPRLSGQITLAGAGLEALAGLAGAAPPFAGRIDGGLSGEAVGASPAALLGAAEVNGQLTLTPAEGARLGGFALGPARTELSLAAGRLAADARLTVDGAELPVSLAVAEAGGLAAGGASPVELTADLPGPTRVSASGTAAASGFTGTIALASQDLRRAAAFAGADLGAADPGALTFASALAASGNALSLSGLTLTGDSLAGGGEVEVRMGGAAPALAGTLRLERLNLDRLLPPPAGPAEAAAGWDDRPLGLEALAGLEGALAVDLGSTAWRGLAFQGGRLTVDFAGAGAALALEGLGVEGGTVSLSLASDGASVPGLSYRLAAAGVPIRPLLVAFAGLDSLRGIGEMTIEGSSRGASQRQIIEALEGQGRALLRDGAIEGVNLAALLRQATALGLDPGAGAAQETDFTELGGSFVIRRGVLSNDDLALRSPLLRLAGRGTVSLPPRRLDYTVEARLAATLEGQGGRDDVSNLPIPVRIHGPWSSPAIEPDVTAALTAFLQGGGRIDSLPQALQGLAGGLAGGLVGGVGGTLDRLTEDPARLLEQAIPALTGGEAPAGGTAPAGTDALPRVLEGLFRGQPPAAPPAAAPPPAAPSPAPPPAPAAEAPRPPEPEELLRQGLRELFR